MGQSLPNSRQSMPLNSLAPRPAKASIAINPSELSRESALPDTALSLFFETVAAVGMSDKEAAYTMGMDPAQLSRVKSGQARLPFDAMWRMPDHFWAAFADGIEQARGLRETGVKRMRAARISELVRLLIEDVA